MPTYSEHVQKLLKRSAKFRSRIERTLKKQDKRVNLAVLGAALDAVDRELVRLGRKRKPKKR